jgi:hypothetical protein
VPPSGAEVGGLSCGAPSALSIWHIKSSEQRFHSRTVASLARWLTVQVPTPIVGATEGRAPQALAVLKSSGFPPMARRPATKASGKSASAAAGAPRSKAKGGPAVGTLGERLAAVERERNALQEELELSRSRVRQLEESHAKVRDRIAWALDSLHNILEGKG